MFHAPQDGSPSWNELAAGARPEVLSVDQFELWDPQRGWQHEAASRIQLWWLDEFVFPRMEEPARAGRKGDQAQVCR